MRQGGIEPPSIAWKATMLTITPLTPVMPTYFAYKLHKLNYQWDQLELSKRKRNYNIMSK
ncbi:Uncharacterized protein BM_BM1260 [Brugia malayi]|uniref:Bm1260 n=1 Tax=Brugia malayi TaxID=6279 RepID=A0A0J9XRY1_BRUMA|nr:Uncharacterized protein BM_BM1260 [Brugia malayi]CDP94515.1 Bm1260 [Brugia malayi]VIO90706.1 Uncharacterized protein BM_BM1260 [Brugia malayi]